MHSEIESDGEKYITKIISQTVRDLLQSSVSRLGTFPVGAPLLRWFYKPALALAIIYLKRLRYVDGVVLRRPDVLVDAFPGESDLDLTILVTLSEAAAEIHTFRRSIEILKAWIPLVGEVWIVQSVNWETHLKYHASDYTADLRTCLVYSKKEFLKETPEFSDAEWAKRRRDLLLYGLPVLRDGARLGKLNRSAVRQRRIGKILWKMGWLERRKEGCRESLQYPKSTQRLNGDTNVLIEQALDRLSGQALPNKRSPLSIITAGSYEGLEASLRARVREALSGICAFAEEIPITIRCFPIRPYAFQYAFVAIAPSERLPEYKSRLQSALTAAFPLLQRTGLGLSPAHLVLFERNHFEALIRHDPLGELFFEAWNWEVVSDTVTTQSGKSYELDRETIQLELTECLDLMDTLIRGNDTNYYLDLLLTAHCLETGLRTGILHLPSRHFDSLIPNPELRARYQARDMQSVDEYCLAELWQQTRACVEQIRRQCRSGLFGIEIL